MVDQKVEIELELQDKASAVLQQIAGSVSDVVKHISEMGKSSDGTNSGITRTAQGVKNLDDKTKDTNKSLTALSGLMARMAGPVGLVALIGVGLVAAANAMDTVAGKRLRFENLSTDLGFTVDQMSVMIQTFKLMGMTGEEANARLVAIGTTLKNIQTRGEGSDVYRTLSTMGRNDFAKQLVAAAKAADGLYHGFEMVNAEYNRIYKEESPRAAALFIETIKGMKESIAKEYSDRSKDVKPERQIDKGVAEEFHKNKQDLKDATMDFINQWAEFFQDQSNKFSRLFTSENLGNFVGKNFNFFDKKPITDPLLLDPPSALKRKGHKFEFEEEEDKKDTNSTLEKIRDSIKNLFSLPGKRYGGPVQQGERVWVGEGGPELFVGGGGNIEVVGASGPEIIVVESAGMIEQFVPNRWTPQVDMPAFESRFGDWNASSFGNRFGDWNASSFGDRFGNWSTKGGGTRPTEGASSPNWMGGVDQSMGPDMSSDDRRQMDVMMMMEANPSPSVNAEFSFKNVPPGVTTSADGEGFDNFTVSKSKAFG